MKRTTDKDEVEEMLRAAEDELLLKLTRNSHSIATNTSSSYPLDSDLTRRYEALKSSTIAKNEPPISHLSSSSSSPLGGDLTSRFAALKDGRPDAAGAPLRPVPICSQGPPRKQAPEKDENEVEAVMRWAMDAVRLGTPDVACTSSSDEDEDVEEDEEDVQLWQKKKMTKKKKKEQDLAVRESRSKEKHGK